MSKSQRFAPYPSPTKVKSRRDMRMVSNVSARKKWLIKYVPEWRGPEIWSGKRVKQYINDVKNRVAPLPMAKKVKIPWAWGCKRIPIFASVVAEYVSDIDSDTDSETELYPIYSFHNYLNAMGFSGI